MAPCHQAPAGKRSGRDTIILLVAAVEVTVTMTMTTTGPAGRGAQAAVERWMACECSSSTTR